MAAITGTGGVILTLSTSGTGSVVWRATAAVTLPSLTAAGVVENSPAFSASIELPAATLSAVGKTGDTAFLNESLPKLTALGYLNSPVALTLPSLEIAAEAVSGSTGSFARSLGALTIAASTSDARTLTLAKSLPKLTGVGVAVSGETLTASATLKALRLDAAIAAGAVATAAVSMPSVTFASAQTVSGRATFDVTLPSLRIVAVMVNGSTLTTTVWSMNTETFDVTNYTNYGFIGFCSIGSSYYGVKTDGIYLLSGADDDGTAIAAVFLSGDADFGVEYKKRMDKAYVGYESDGDMVLTANGKEYPLEREISTTGIKNSRVSLAKGIKSRYWNIGMKNVDGSDFHINELGVLPRILERKT